MLSRVRQAEKPYLRHDLDPVEIGDTASVAVRIKEGERERVQTFTGTVIKIRGGGLGRTFTVRRIVQGEGVERIFPFHSPTIDSIEVTRKGKVRRAKLYYLRDRVGKATRLREVLGPRRAKKSTAAAGSQTPDAQQAAGTPQVPGSAAAPDASQDAAPVEPAATGK